MQTILFPTDFSPGAQSVTELAVRLAQASDAQLVVLHSFSVMPAEPMQPGFVAANLEESVRESDEAQLEAIRQQMIEQYGFHKVRMIARPGFAVEEILNAAEDLKIDLIVQATLGSEGLERVLFSSNSALVLEQAKCPVLIVPGDLPMRAMSKVVLAVDFGSFSPASLTKLAPICAALRADLNLLHMAPPDAKDIEQRKAQLEAIAASSPIANTTSTVFTHEDVYEGLKLYMEVVPDGVLAMHTHKRNFFQKFFNSSLTKKMAYDAAFPLIALH